MSTRKRPSSSSEVRIDESRMREAQETSVPARLLNVLYTVVLGIVLVQAFYFLFRGGSVVLLFDNIFFRVFMGVCAMLGWFFGDNVITWLKDEIRNWWPW